MQIENITNPDQEPVEGDVIKITHHSGATEIKTYWQPVVIEETSIQYWKITQLAFKNRFPRDKWKAAKALRSMDADIDDFFESFELATHIDLKEQETIDSVTSLGTSDVPESIRLTPEEIDAVLNVPAQPKEIFNR